MRRRSFVLLVLVAMLGACGGGGASKSSLTTDSGVSTPTTGSAVTEPLPAATGGSSTTASPGAASTVPVTVARTTPKAPATTAGTAPGPGGCALAPQAPPVGPISATFATALAFAPDGRLFFTERGGTVRVYQGGQSKVFATVNTVTTEPGGGYSERGLLGLAIDPNFSQNHFVYAFYSDIDYSHQRVIRWTDCAGVGTAARILITLPSGSDCCHKGGRLAFGPDGKLFVTLGEERDPPVAQVKSDLRGKVLRYNSDGSIPGDNPFGGGNPVWVYGLRNPFGIAFSAGGQLAVTSNGPSGEFPPPGPSTGYDTVIFAAPRGGGYQWPNCYGYGHTNPGYALPCPGLLPSWSSESSTVVPTGATFVDGSGPAPTRGKLVVCTVDKGMLIFTPGSPGTAPGAGPSDCLLDVKEGPNHALYYSDFTSINRLG